MGASAENCQFVFIYEIYIRNFVPASGFTIAKMEPEEMSAFHPMCEETYGHPIQAAFSRKSVMRSSFGAMPFFCSTMPALPR